MFEKLQKIYYTTGNDKKYVKIFDNALPKQDPWKLTLRGRSISRYSIIIRNEYVMYGNWLARNWKNKSFYEVPKIVVRETGKRIIATLDLENRYLLSSLYSIYPKNSDENLSLEYLLAIINSSLSTFIAKLIALELTTGAFTKFRTNQLGRLPIHELNFNNHVEVNRYNEIISYVNQMFILNNNLNNCNNPTEIAIFRRQIDTVDSKIDALVYELYSLTDEEIKLVDEYTG